MWNITNENVFFFFFLFKTISESFVTLRIAEVITGQKEAI